METLSTQKSIVLYRLCVAAICSLILMSGCAESAPDKTDAKTDNSTADKTADDVKNTSEDEKTENESQSADSDQVNDQNAAKSETDESTETQKTAVKKDAKVELEKITLGAGCFWCIEAILDRVDGVKKATSGYTGGQVKNPTYKQICTGLTGHAEVVEVEFDPQTIKLDELLDLFWQLHDPTTLNRQGADVGTQYRSAIYYHNDEQKKIAEASKKKWNESGKFKSPIVTEITKAPIFYVAEDYHQEYFVNNPGNPYCQYNIPPKLKKLGLDKPKKEEK